MSVSVSMSISALHYECYVRHGNYLVDFQDPYEVAWNLEGSLAGGGKGKIKLKNLYAALFKEYL